MDDQPMSRRERRARERAQEAMSDSSAESSASDVPSAATPHDPAASPRPMIRPAHSSSPGTPTHPVTVVPAVVGSSAAGTAGGGATSAASAAGKSPKREYEPLGPVRGTIRVFGELCITVGLVLILFVVWQLWWTDFAANEDNANLADELRNEWQAEPKDELPPDPDTPVVAEPVDENEAFGIMYIPRFGDDYYRTIAEGVSLDPVLNTMGLGHYPTSGMPGEVGNFAMAGHRVTYGKPLNLVAELRPGDKAVVQTKDGFYTYTYRNFEIVLPDAVDVLAPVPTMPDYKGKDRLMTLTACNPMFSARERYVAYFELSEWDPAADGAPDSIKDSEAFADAGGKD